MESPDIHAPHARHGAGLPRWLELLIGLTALATSISSIAIALHHGEMMEKLVAASSIPYMEGGFSDVTPEGAQVLSLDLMNRGVGPAHEQSLRVRVDGKPVTSVRHLIAVSVGPEHAALATNALPSTRNGMKTRFVPAGQSQFVFRIARTAQNAAYWDKLEKAQDRWDVAYCYCSVFHECWRGGGDWEDPKPVKQCARDEKSEFKP